MKRRQLLVRAAALAAVVAVVGSVHAMQEGAARPVARLGRSSVPVHLIVDTDIFSDTDDAGALAIANASQDNGKVDLLGVMVDTASTWGAPAVDAIDTYYGHRNIPIGTLKPNDNSTTLPNYAQYLAQHYPNSLQSGTRAPNAVSLYRKILAGQPGHSVTIAAIGVETNLANLLDSPPDRYSRLDGSDLVKQKVRLLSMMGGQYPSGSEFNFTSAPAAAQRVVNQWPTRVVFDGYSVGKTVMTGSQLFKQTSPADPVTKAYEIYTGYGNDRSSWDPTTVFYAIYGTDHLFTLAGGTGSNHVTADGTNHYVASPDKDQNYLVKAASDTTIARTLSNLMVQPPRVGRHPSRQMSTPSTAH